MQEELFDTLRDLGKKIVHVDDEVIGVKFLIFFKNGKTVEYNSRQDEEI